MVRAVLLSAIALLSTAFARAEIVSPWAPGQDMEQFYSQYCAVSDLEAHYFPALDKKQLDGLTKLLSEVLWIDVSDYLLNINGSRTQSVVARYQTLNKPVSSELLTAMREASHEPMRSKYVYARNRNTVQRERVLDTFSALAKSDVKLAGAMITYLDCRTVANVQKLDPVAATRMAQVKKLDIRVEPSRSQDVGSGPTYSDPSCSCAGGNVCYGPRGGRYCITSGGKKRYGI